MSKQQPFAKDITTMSECDTFKFINIEVLSIL